MWVMNGIMHNFYFDRLAKLKSKARLVQVSQRCQAEIPTPGDVSDKIVGQDLIKSDSRVLRNVPVDQQAEENVKKYKTSVERLC